MAHCNASSSTITQKLLNKHSGGHLIQEASSDFPSSMKSQPHSLHLTGGAWTVSGHCVQIHYISEEGPVWRRDHGPLPGQCHQGRRPRKAPHHCCHPHLLHPGGGAGVGVPPQLPPVTGACTLSQFSHCTCIWPAMEREVAAGHVALPGGLSHQGSCISSGLELLCAAAIHGETSSARMLRGLDVRWKAALPTIAQSALPLSQHRGSSRMPPSILSVAFPRWRM